MDLKHGVELAVARTDNLAVSTVAIAGIVALCNELGTSGMLDEEQVHRIRAFMLLSIERSGASQTLAAHLENLLSYHFSDLRKRMS